MLTVVEPGTLPETIRSRCRSVVLRPVPPAAIERVLTEQYRVESAQATLLARLADGRIGWAIRAAVDDTFMQRRARILDDAAILPRTGRIERFSWAEKTAADFSRDRVRVYDTLSLLASWWRDVLHHGAGRAHGIINTDRSEEIADVSAICPPAGAVGMLRAILRARRDLDANVNARLALEALVLRLPPARQVAGR